MPPSQVAEQVPQSDQSDHSPTHCLVVVVVVVVVVEVVVVVVVKHDSTSIQVFF